MSKKPVQKILRIGLFQNGKFIEERLIHARKSVTIGQGMSNTFVFPDARLPRSFTVLEAGRDGQYVLHFNDAMVGKLSVADGTQPLSELARSGKARKQGAEYIVPIREDHYGRVAFGEGSDEVALLFQFVKPPPPRPKPVLPASMRGGVINGVMASAILGITCALSALLQIGFIAFALSQDWPEPRDIDYRMPDRFVSIMVDEPEEEEVEIPEPEVVEEGEGPGQGQEEAPAEPAGDGGEEEEEAAAEPQSAEERAAAEADRKRRMAEEVRSKTILSQLGAISSEGGSLVDSLTEGAGKTSMDEAFANSQGIKAGVAGAEKSGLRTSGSSDADGKGAAVGIEDMGKSAGARAAEKGVSTGGKREEKQVKANIKYGEEKVVGTGVLDPGAISRVIKRRQSQIQSCYEREIKKNPTASGKVVVTFTIGAAGRVTQSRASSDSVGGGVGTCVAGVIKRFRFPRPNGGEIIVNKSFVFEVSQ